MTHGGEHRREMVAAPRIEVRGIQKRFAGVAALDGVDLSLAPGEVLGLLGENGAGKSTLMKILAGVQQPSAGEIRVDGRPVRLLSVRDALDLGIVLIHQELNLADNLDAGANIFLGREPRRWGLIDKRRIAAEAGRWLAEIGLNIPPGRLVGSLAVGQQQLVEIAKAVSVDARVLIMDEPTSSLSQHETEILFEVIKKLRVRGVSIIYISHRLGEVKHLADRVVVLRDGKNAGELPRGEVEHERMISLMVGRDLSSFYDHVPRPAGRTMLEVEKLVVPGRRRQHVDFQVRSGEIVALAGLVGAGRTELLRVLFGIDRALDGTIKIDGRKVALRSPGDALAAGVALVPEDRKQHGLVLEMSLRENVGLASLWRDRLAAALVNRRRERALAAEAIRTLGIRTPGDRLAVQYLSGGNQQKVVLGKWLAMKPSVLLLDEPTRGVDVGAKREIYHLMDEIARSGTAVLFASSEMEEILHMADRVLVMHEGRVAGELARSQLSEENVMRLATGEAAAAAA